MLKLRSKVHVFIDEGPYIGVLLNGHVGRFPGTMTGVCINTDHHGALTLVFLLKCGSIFKGVGRYHPVVMIPGGDKNSGIIHISRDVVDG